METYKLTKSATKEVIASLNVEGFDFKDIVASKETINSWLKDMSYGHLTFRMKTPKHWIITSDSKEWRGYFDQVADAILVEKTTYSTVIAPETTKFAQELIARLMSNSCDNCRHQ